MKAAVIGGSIGGLITGIALQKIGYEVDIYERSPTAMQDRGAGLVIQPDLMDYMIYNDISSNELFGVPATERQTLNKHGDAVHRFKNDTSFTSWSYVWKQLKDYFPEDHYHYGHQLTRVQQSPDLVQGRFQNGKEISADLLIGADGYSSVVRDHLFPGSMPTYSGYIAYRGLIPEKDLTNEVVEFFSNKFTLYPYEHSHLLSYLVPGTNGELNEGLRQLNWVWYVNKNEDELKSVMTDKDGRIRDFSVPSTFLSVESMNDLHERAKKELPTILAERVLQTANPFVQVVVDMEVPKMYKGRIAILGDAASVVRPHTASGTAKAFRDAIVLASALSKDKNMDHAMQYWNSIEMANTTDLIAYGRKLAKGSGLGYY